MQGDVIFLDGTIKMSERGILSSSAIVILALSIVYLEGIYYSPASTLKLGSNINGYGAELYLILLTNIIGIIFLIDSNDWLITVITWELFNLSLYLLVSINSQEEASLSAAVKYFLLSALTTGFLLMSVTLLYGTTGSTNYETIIMLLSTAQYTQESSTFGSYINFSYLAPILMIITFIFKLGGAPLHNWSIDLYDTLPTTITLWMVTIPKIGLLLTFGSFLPIFMEMGMNYYTTAIPPVIIVLCLISVISLMVGSIGLSSQWKIKRFLAYSSVTNLGFILLAYVSGGETIIQGTINDIDGLLSFYIYLAIYSVTGIGIFTILILIGKVQKTANGEIIMIQELSGIYRLNPTLTITFTIFIFSLIGLPPLAGFFSKLLVLKGLLDLGHVLIPVLAILFSVISAVNYLSVIKICCFDLPVVPGAVTVVNHHLNYGGIHVPLSLSYFIQFILIVVTLGIPNFTNLLSLLCVYGLINLVTI